MLTLSEGTRVTGMDYNTALTLEARRRGISDGVLMAATDWRERENIVSAYLQQKKREVKRKRQQCSGCAYYVKMCNNPNEKMCSFHQTERMRRKDTDGNCLEYTRQKRRYSVPMEPKERKIGQREGTATWRLMHEDFSKDIIPEIADKIGKDDDSVRQLICAIKRNTGYVVPYKRMREP